MVPKTVFQGPIDKNLIDAARPPTRRTSVTRLKKLPTAPLPEIMFQAELSTSSGLPNEDSEAGLSRTEAGQVKPTKSTAVQATFELKLMDLCSAWVRFEKRTPSRGLGATKLLLTAAAEKRGQKAMRAAMLNNIMVKFVQPEGIRKKSKLPKLLVRTNVIYMDESADVTFGATSYPTWVRRLP